jgi:hypothetical protein
MALIIDALNFNKACFKLGIKKSQGQKREI